VTDPVSSALVQVIHLSWDKSARGGQGARDRASVPLAFDVSEGHLRDAGGLFHAEELLWGKDNAFAEPREARHQRIPLEKGYCYGCVTVSAHPEGLAVRYQWNPSRGGAPERRFLDIGQNDDLIVQAGEWMRICYNGRFSDCDTGGWWYEQTTINLAAFGGQPSGKIFVDSEPARDLRLLADLW
jgi:hypothetical protein